MSGGGVRELKGGALLLTQKLQESHVEMRPAPDLD